MKDGRWPFVVIAHVDAFEVTSVASAGIALLGVLVSLFLVRRTDQVHAGPTFSRRSRWSSPPRAARRRSPGGRHGRGPAQSADG